MSKRAHSAVRGSVGFAIGSLVATSLAFFGFRLVGLILGGAVAGAFLAWRGKDFPLIMLAGAGAALGLLLGGLVVVMAFGVLAFGMFEAPDQPNVAVLIFYLVFVCGFAVAGISISAATAFRLLTAQASVVAFAVGGAIGGAVIVGSVILRGTTGAVVFPGLLISVIVAGAFSGASLNYSEDVSLTILKHRADQSEVSKSSSTARKPGLR